MKKLSISLFFILPCLFFFSSCKTLQNATEEELVLKTVDILQEALFIQEYGKFTDQMLKTAGKVHELHANDKITGSQYLKLEKSYSQTQKRIELLFEELVFDLVTDIDKMVSNEDFYRDKYLQKFKGEIEDAKLADSFLGMYTKYSDQDAVGILSIIKIVGPLVLEGIRYFVKNSSKFKSLSKEALAGPVLERFGLPDFNEIANNR